MLFTSGFVWVDIWNLSEDSPYPPAFAVKVFVLVKSAEDHVVFVFPLLLTLKVMFGSEAQVNENVKWIGIVGNDKLPKSKF